MFWGEPKPSWYCSTFCTSSGSFPSKEVTFNVRSQCAQFPAIAGHPACNTPDLDALHCSWWAHWEGGLLGQDPTTTCSPASCLPRLGSLFPVRYSSTLVLIRVLWIAICLTPPLSLYCLGWPYQGLITTRLTGKEGLTNVSIMERWKFIYIKFMLTSNKIKMLLSRNYNPELN